MDEWYNILVDELTNNNTEQVDILEYFYLCTICYGITEYIYKKTIYNTSNKTSKEKEQLLNKSYSIQLDYIYNGTFYYNHLKHMNKKNTAFWKKMTNTHLDIYAEKLRNNTLSLIELYNLRKITIIPITEFFKKNMISQLEDYHTSIRKSISTQLNFTESYNGLLENISTQLNFIESYNELLESISRPLKILSSYQETINNISKQLNFTESYNELLESISTQLNFTE